MVHLQRAVAVEEERRPQVVAAGAGAVVVLQQQAVAVAVVLPCSSWEQQLAAVEGAGHPATAVNQMDYPWEGEVVGHLQTDFLARAVSLTAAAAEEGCLA